MRAILQSEARECSLACLVMIGNHYGHDINLVEMRRVGSVSLKGTNLKQVINHAEKIGFSCRPLRLEMNEIKDLKTPCIIHWDLNHFVVLEKIKGNSLFIKDPALGSRVLSFEEVSEHFTGIAIEVTPNADFKPIKKKERISLIELLNSAIGLKKSLLIIFFIALCLEFITILIPQVTQWIVDGSLTSGDRELLLVAVIGGIIIVAVEFILRMARGWVGLILNQQLTLQWSSNLFNHLIRLPISFFEKRTLGDISSRFQSLSAVRTMITNGAIMVVLDGIMTMATLFMMTMYSVDLTILVVLSLMLYALLRLFFYYPLRRASEERIVLSARENSFFLETIRAIQPIKMFNLTALRLSSWKNMLADVQVRDVKTQKIILYFSSLNTLIFGVESMLLLYIGGISVIDKDITLGMLLAFIAYKNQFTNRASKVIDLGVEAKMLSLHSERLSDIALEDTEKNLFFGSDGSTDYTIELRNISFRYAEGEPWILNNISLKIEYGESVAITGKSGCGKSTLYKILLGILEPTEGDVFFGSKPLSKLGLYSLRDAVGTVMQDDRLLSGTILENITSFDPDLDLSYVEKVATIANIHDAINNLPMGYQTLISESGSGLSGGQKQRILLARALYKKPKILALDEATSHLDIYSEKHIVSELSHLGITVISIAHRKETILSMERVVRLNNGGIEKDSKILSSS
jgi:ATP-binding cassette subfamily B protein RaxB